MQRGRRVDILPGFFCGGAVPLSARGGARGVLLSAAVGGAELHDIAPDDTAALRDFIDAIEDVSSWEPFDLHSYIDIITGHINGIDAPRSICHRTITI